MLLDPLLDSLPVSVEVRLEPGKLLTRRALEAGEVLLLAGEAACQLAEGSVEGGCEAVRSLLHRIDVGTPLLFEGLLLPPDRLSGLLGTPVDLATPLLEGRTSLAGGRLDGNPGLLKALHGLLAQAVVLVPLSIEGGEAVVEIALEVVQAALEVAPDGVDVAVEVLSAVGKHARKLSCELVRLGLVGFGDGVQVAFRLLDELLGRDGELLEALVDGVDLGAEVLDDLLYPVGLLDLGLDGADAVLGVVRLDAELVECELVAPAHGLEGDQVALVVGQVREGLVDGRNKVIDLVLLGLDPLAGVLGGLVDAGHRLLALRTEEGDLLLDGLQGTALLVLSPEDKDDDHRYDEQRERQNQREKVHNPKHSFSIENHSSK